jgi:hypothetical protein
MQGKCALGSMTRIASWINFSHYTASSRNALRANKKLSYSRPKGTFVCNAGKEEPNPKSVGKACYPCRNISGLLANRLADVARADS